MQKVVRQVPSGGFASEAGRREPGGNAQPVQRILAPHLEHRRHQGLHGALHIRNVQRYTCRQQARFLRGRGRLTPKHSRAVTSWRRSRVTRQLRPLRNRNTRAPLGGYGRPSPGVLGPQSDGRRDRVRRPCRGNGAQTRAAVFGPWSGSWGYGRRTARVGREQDTEIRTQSRSSLPTCPVVAWQSGRRAFRIVCGRPRARGRLGGGLRDGPAEGTGGQDWGRAVAGGARIPLGENRNGAGSSDLTGTRTGGGAEAPQGAPELSRRRPKARLTRRRARRPPAAIVEAVRVILVREEAINGVGVTGANTAPGRERSTRR
jgi:hypothetical protein